MEENQNVNIPSENQTSNPPESSSTPSAPHKSKKLLYLLIAFIVLFILVAGGTSAVYFSNYFAPQPTPTPTQLEPSP